MNNLRLCVIDDFYPDPQVVRQYALSLPFKEMESSAEKTFYKGRLTEPQHGFSQMGLELIAAHLRKLIYWRMPTGEFRLIFERMKDDPHRKTWIHFDSMVTRYAAIVYLNEPEQCEGGTAFYRHRETGWDDVPDLDSTAWHHARAHVKDARNPPQDVRGRRLRDRQQMGSAVRRTDAVQPMHHLRQPPVSCSPRRIRPQQRRRPADAEFLLRCRIVTTAVPGPLRARVAVGARQSIIHGTTDIS
jgi:Family of unknown function (DUF6445)